MYRARICKRLSRRGIDLGIDSARQVGNRFLGSLKGLAGVHCQANYAKLKTKFVCIIKIIMKKNNGEDK